MASYLNSVDLNNEILMIGPDCQGGITSVINMYKNFGLDVIYMPSYKRNSIFGQILIYSSFICKYISTLLTNYNIKIVHIHSASYGSFLRKSIVLRIAKFFKKKVIFHIHGAEFELFYQRSSQIKQKNITRILDKADAIIVLSKQWKESISKISSNKNIIILYNPTSIKELKHVPSETTRFLFMGRIEKRKGVYEIIESAKHIKNQNIEVNLYGDGSIEKFANMIKEEKLEQKIKIKGWISGDKKDEVYYNSDVLLLPSFNEGLPMSILEAMAYGLPVISTPVGGIAEAVEEGVNGFLVSPGDAKALAEKMDLLTNDNALREKMGQESYKFAKEKFDIKVIIEQLQEIYEQLLK